MTFVVRDKVAISFDKFFYCTTLNVLNTFDSANTKMPLILSNILC